MFMNIHPDLVTENKGHSSNIVSMLDHRRRRWPNILTALVQVLVFVGKGNRM